MNEERVDVGCYSGQKYGERPAWVELEGERREVARVLRQWREERGLGFELALIDGRKLVLYYDESNDIWYAVR